MKQVIKVVSAIAITCRWLSIILLASLLLLIVADVALRFVLNAPISGAYEIVQFLLMMTLCFSMAVAQKQGIHIKVTMLIDKFPRKLRLFSKGLFTLLAALTVVVLTYCGWLQAAALQKSGFVSTTLRLPYYPYEYISSVGLAIFALTLFWDSIRYFIATFRDDLEEVLQTKGE